MQNFKKTYYNENKGRTCADSETPTVSRIPQPQRGPPRNGKPIANGPRGCTPSVSGVEEKSERKNINPAHRNQRPSSVQLRNGRTLVQDNAMNARTRPRSIVSARLDTNKSFNRPKRRAETKSPIPDQETIRKREELEVPQTSPISPTKSVLDVDCGVSTGKMSWDDKVQLFERMKDELGHRQSCIMQLFVDIKNEHRKMSARGQSVALPPVNDLNIMNVARINPEQLLHLCSIGTNNMADLTLGTKVSSLNLDIEKLAELPSKLIAASDLTLQKRKEVVDWFDTLKNEERGIPMSKLTKKINEFNAENEMLSSSLQACKAEFAGEVKQFVDDLRLGITEALSMQLRVKDLMYEVSHLSTENANLKKQLQSYESNNWPHNVEKIQELQTALEEEKEKKERMKERVARAEGQTKIAQEHVEQLEAALELARAQNMTLETTVSQLSEQNQKLQMDLEAELGKLTNSMKENTSHLQEIADAREKLQEEKELLQSRLDAITTSNSATLQNLEEELRTTREKLGRTEKQLKEANKSIKAMEEKLQGFYNGLQEAEVRAKDLVRQLQDKDEEIDWKDASARNDIRRLTGINHELNKTLEDIKENFKEMNDIEENLKSQLIAKGDYIAELENKVEELEKEGFLSKQKTQENEQKIKSFKMELEQMRSDLGDFKDVGEILELVKQQRNELLDITRQNGELAEALQQKEQELVRHLDLLAEKDRDLEDKDELIQRLTEKDKEQVNIVKLLRNNLEMRSKADHEINEQLADKTAEIKSLINNLEARKKQISQLEKIILTLEEQLRKVCWQRKKDQEKIDALEKVVNVKKGIRHIDQKPSGAVTAEDLDKLIKILEEELETPQPSEGVQSKGEKNCTDRTSNECPTNDAALNCENQLSRQMLLSKLNWFSWYNGVAKSIDQKDIKRDGFPADIQKLPTRLEATYNSAVSEDTKGLDKTSLFDHDLPVVDRFAGPNAYKRRKMFKFAGHKF